MAVTVFVDLETGGVLPQHPTISLAAIAVDGDVEVSAFSVRLQFDEAACDLEALRLNHYTREAWADAVPPAVAVARFADWLKPFQTLERVSKAGKPYTVAQLAGYNILTFDGPRLRALFGERFFPSAFLHRDILQRVLFYFDESGHAPPENFKLATVAGYFGLPVDGAHDALTDARMCAAVYRCVKEAW